LALRSSAWLEQERAGWRKTATRLAGETGANKMKRRDVINLLNRAAAGLEHIVSLSEKERDELVEDLVVAAREEAQKYHQEED
jgi:hypothetical protein